MAMKAYNQKMARNALKTCKSNELSRVCKGLPCDIFFFSFIHIDRTVEKPYSPKHCNKCFSRSSVCKEHERTQKLSCLHASIVKSALTSHHIARIMNELTQERSRIRASILKRALASHHIARCMNELTQERSRIHASILKRALASHQSARYMNELTQERSHIHASIVKRALGSHHNASDTNELT